MNKHVKTYGLIGESLSHSFSPSYFEDKFSQEKLEDCQYLTFPLKEIQEFDELLAAYDLKGLNVTIPYKRTILPYLDELIGAAKEIQAVNCIAFRKGKLIGYNTDVLGFEYSLKPLLNKEHSNALIMGTGGAAQAVAYVLKKLGISYEYVSSQNHPDYLNYREAVEQISEFPLIINTTPVGMYPNVEECPLIDLDGLGQNHLVYDLIYNPAKTLLLQKAEAFDAQTKNGLEMLEIQAKESWKIWQA